jgi:hypothetical protein
LIYILSRVLPVLDIVATVVSGNPKSAAFIIAANSVSFSARSLWIYGYGFSKLTANL